MHFQLVEGINFIYLEKLSLTHCQQKTITALCVGGLQQWCIEDIFSLKGTFLGFWHICKKGHLGKCIQWHLYNSLLSKRFSFKAKRKVPRQRFCRANVKLFAVTKSLTFDQSICHKELFRSRYDYFVQNFLFLLCHLHILAQSLICY